MVGTPHESIAFIYKSLGCLHSLQPAHHTRAIAFTDPTVPALKTEGWIMWQTIQLLLGPEEHAGFIREAVQQWDIRDPDTGDLYPKILPRRCFPEAPDKHMVAWYEGVSERLRREADEEERQKRIEVRVRPSVGSVCSHALVMGNAARRHTHGWLILAEFGHNPISVNNNAKCPTVQSIITETR
jgi:hypothetical protein